MHNNSALFVAPMENGSPLIDLSALGLLEDGMGWSCIGHVNASQKTCVIRLWLADDQLNEVADKNNLLYIEDVPSADAILGARVKPNNNGNGKPPKRVKKRMSAIRSWLKGRGHRTQDVDTICADDRSVTMAVRELHNIRDDDWRVGRA